MPSKPPKKHWSIDDLDFSSIDVARVRDDENLFYLVTCGSFIESGSDMYTNNLIELFDGDVEVQDWLRHKWEIEETQHGHALRAYVEYVWPEFEWDRTYKEFLAEYAQYCKVELLEPTRTQELAARCVVETGSSTTYRAIARSVDEPVLKKLLNWLADDEVNHYKYFYQHFQRYREQEKMGRARILMTLCRRTLEMKNEDSDCAIRHVMNARAPQQAGDVARIREISAHMSRTVRTNLRPENTLKMIMRPLELPTRVQQIFEFPLRQFMQHIFLRG